MDVKTFVICVFALNLCKVAMSTDVANAFNTDGVVPDAVDVAPQEELKVFNPEIQLIKHFEGYTQWFFFYLCRSPIRAASRPISEMS